MAIVDLQRNVVEALDVPERNYRFPHVSPDALRLAVEVVGGDADIDIYLYDLSGRSEMRPFATEGDVNLAPYWRDDRTLLYASDRDGKRRIYQQSIDGGAAVPLTDPAEGEGHANPSVTPGPDAALTFTAEFGRPSQIQIMVMPFDGEPVPLVNHGRVADARFSPRGDAISFWGATGPNYESFGVHVARYPPAVMPYPPDDAGLLASREDAPGVFPIWVQSDDNAPLTLIYRQFGSLSIQALDVEMPAMLFSNRRTVTNTAGGLVRSYAAIPGTDRLVVVRPSAVDDEDASDFFPPPDRIVVIQNWAEELRQRARMD